MKINIIYLFALLLLIGGKSFAQSDRQRQRLFDNIGRQTTNNISDVNNKTNEARDVINQLSNIDHDEGGKVMEKLNQFLARDNVKNLDYSDNERSSWVINNIDKIETTAKNEIAQLQQAHPKPVETVQKPTKPKVYTGTVAVYGMSPIYKQPDSYKDEDVVARVESEEVVVISRYNDYYYYVQYGNVRGYLQSSWIK